MIITKTHVRKVYRSMAVWYFPHSLRLRNPKFGLASRKGGANSDWLVKGAWFFTVSVELSASSQGRLT